MQIEMNKSVSPHPYLFAEINNKLNFDNFVLLPNTQRYKIWLQLSTAIKTTEFTSFYIHSLPANGLTHFLQAFAEQQLCTYIDCMQLTDGRQLQKISGKLVLLDNIQYVAKQQEMAISIQILYDKIKVAGGSIVLAHTVIDTDYFDTLLKDLKSRLTECVQIKMPVLTKDELSDIFLERSERRGLQISAESFNYMYDRSKRDVKTLMQGLEKLEVLPTIRKESLKLKHIKTILR